MKKVALPLIVCLLSLQKAVSQSFPVDTLMYHGTSAKYINMVIMGDGYTSSQQNTFITNAQTLSNFLFAQAPWSIYKNYFNVFAIRVVSTQSGAKHAGNASDCFSAIPNVPVSNPTTYFDCRFDSYGIHRLVVPFNTSNLMSVLATNFPNYDQAFVIANSAFYGGSGGTYATSTANTSSNEVSAHEIGHSFANLADEYWAGDIYAAEKPNQTQQTNTNQVKWKNWMNTNNIGIFQHSGTTVAQSWYRPHNNCKMRFLNQPFCSVCTETIIEKIHSLANPVAAYTPAALTVNSPEQVITFRLSELMKPTPNTLKITWRLNGNAIATNRDSVQIDQSSLPNGNSSLVVSVVDTNTLLRVNNHSTLHLSTVTWTINKIFTGVEVSSTENRSEMTVFPNPAENILNIDLEVKRPEKLSLQLISMDGKISRTLLKNVSVNGQFKDAFNIEKLPAGEYLLHYKIGELLQTERFVKL